MRLCLACFILLACFDARRAAQAATTCTMSTAGGVFGNYDPTASTTLTVIGSGRVVCTYTGTGFDASITASSGSSGSFANRTLVLGSHKLTYNIYLDPAHTEVLGNGTSGTYAIPLCFAGGTFTCPSGGATSGSTYTAPVYALLPGGQDVPAGTYSDTVVLTITY